MKRLIQLCACTALIAGFAVTDVMASGFALYEGSARGVAMGGLTGSADDPSALFYNPAGITQLEGRNYMLGISPIMPSSSVQSTNIYDGTVTATDNEENIGLPPHFYYTSQINNRWWWGLGFMSRFGLASEFESDWAGRYDSYNAAIATVMLNPNVAWKVNDHVSLAAGVSFLFAKVELENTVDAGRFFVLPHHDPRTSTYDVNQTISGDDVAFGYNWAAHFKLNDNVRFGVTYNSQIELGLDVDVEFHRVNPSAPIPGSWFGDTSGAVDLDLPETVFTGAFFKLNKKTNLELGVVYTNWSSFQNLQLQYQDPIIEVPHLGIEVDSITRIQDWDDVFRYNFGLEYVANDTWTFRGGMIYDESPVPSETFSFTVPTWHRTLYDMGIGYTYGDWQIDASFALLLIDDRTVPGRQLEDGFLASTTTDSQALIWSLSLTHKL